MIAVDRTLFKGFHHHRLYGGRHIRVDLPRGPGPDLHMLQRDGDRRFPVKGHLACQHLIEHDANAVQVTGYGRHLALRLLGRKVMHRTHHGFIGIRDCRRFGPHHARDAEV
ncbi:hypothetical protein SDC9_177038 [bioreactor metagenome]|uniref:Uncharacterized protein n=1 Tax=bioreactor metagenome TaxID=1076179 RepID=A0A645GS68_9ZZZZ